MTSHQGIENKLLRLRPMEPSLELRQKLFAQIDIVSPSRLHFLDRLWFSRPMRFAAATMLVLATALSVSESRQLDLQIVAITGSTREEPEQLDLDQALEMELGITEYDQYRWRLASRPGSLRSRTYQQHLAALMEL